MKQVNLFLDMDGTLAKFYANPNYLEKMYEQGYFENLKPYAIVDTIKEIIKEMPVVNVYILTACVDTDYCEEEKDKWLDKYLPELPLDHRLYLKVGENKTQLADLVAHKDAINLLLDDYGLNLEQWEEKGWTAIKFINGINNKKGKEYKYTVKGGKQLKELITRVVLKGGAI